MEDDRAAMGSDLRFPVAKPVTALCGREFIDEIGGGLECCSYCVVWRGFAVETAPTCFC